MARKVKDMPARNAKDRYNYADWFDGNIWELTKGEDFDITVEGMRSSLHNAARRKGVMVTTRVRDDSIFVQVTPEETDGED